jgi:hypothetical protein
MSADHTCIHHSDAERAEADRECPVCMLRKTRQLRNLIDEYEQLGQDKTKFVRNNAVERLEVLLEYFGAWKS